MAFQHQRLITGKSIISVWNDLNLISVLQIFLAHFRVIHIDDDSAIEYDCTENFLTHDYCIHIMSRTPTMSEEKLQMLLEYAGN